VLALLLLLGDSWGAFRFPWPLVVIGLLVLWLVTRDGARRTPPAAPSAAAFAGPTGPAAPEAGAAGPAGPAATAPGLPAPAGPAGGPPWTPPPAYVPPPPAPPDPRRRGPRLFGATLALIALALGVLGMVDLAGADLPAAAYPALAVAVCGAVLLLGAFWGRAGGVILIGLVASAVLVGTAAGDRWDGSWDGDRTVVAPASAAELGSGYSFDPGDAVVDLTGITDVDRLDGRVVTVDGSVGQVTVRVPRGVAVVLDASIDGPGAIDAFGRNADGWGVDRVWHHGSRSEPTLRLVVNLSVGHVEVDQS
jgi:hypothetical protein